MNYKGNEFLKSVPVNHSLSKEEVKEKDLEVFDRYFQKYVQKNRLTDGLGVIQTKDGRLVLVIEGRICCVDNISVIVVTEDGREFTQTADFSFFKPDKSRKDMFFYINDEAFSYKGKKIQNRLESCKLYVKSGSARLLVYFNHKKHIYPIVLSDVCDEGICTLEDGTTVTSIDNIASVISKYAP